MMGAWPCARPMMGVNNSRYADSQLLAAKETCSELEAVHLDFKY